MNLTLADIKCVLCRFVIVANGVGYWCNELTSAEGEGLPIVAYAMRDSTSVVLTSLSHGTKIDKTEAPGWTGRVVDILRRDNAVRVEFVNATDRRGLRYRTRTTS